MFTLYTPPLAYVLVLALSPMDIRPKSTHALVCTTSYVLPAAVAPPLVRSFMFALHLCILSQLQSQFFGYNLFGLGELCNIRFVMDMCTW